MRHSFATLTIHEGASIKAVSEYLGHNTVAIIMSMYAHGSLGKRQKVMRELKGVQPRVLRRPGIR
jgi:site-specific recombinase XerD